MVWFGQGQQEEGPGHPDVPCTWSAKRTSSVDLTNFSLHAFLQRSLLRFIPSRRCMQCVTFMPERSAIATHCRPAPLTLTNPRSHVYLIPALNMTTVVYQHSPSPRSPFSKKMIPDTRLSLADDKFVARRGKCMHLSCGPPYPPASFVPFFLNQFIFWHTVP